MFVAETPGKVDEPAPSNASVEEATEGEAPPAGLAGENLGPVKERRSASPGREFRAAMVDAAREVTRWVLGDGLSEVLGRRIELRVGTLLGIAMVTVVIGLLLIVAAGIRREGEVYDNFFATPTSTPPPDRSSAGAEPARDDRAGEIARNLRFPPPMPLLSPMAGQAPVGDDSIVSGVDRAPSSAPPRRPRRVELRQVGSAS